MKKSIFSFVIFLSFFSCQKHQNTDNQEITNPNLPFLMVLGIAQDAGFPQANCKKSCCKSVWQNSMERKMVSCLGLVDPVANEGWIFDATPDFKDQLFKLENSVSNKKINLAGVFLTHAHIGHYTGLMHLGHEAMGAKKIPVYAMPRMKNYLKNNGPWSQLVSLENIELKALKADSTILLNNEFSITPLQVPHRDEFSETVGFLISGKEKDALFIPDIDKWHLWEEDILELISNVDYAFLDGTFYKNGEIWGRDMSQIPHPFIEESLSLFEKLSPIDKAKVHFIHFNHTNPVLQKDSEARREILEEGFRISEEFSKFHL